MYSCQKQVSLKLLCMELKPQNEDRMKEINRMPPAKWVGVALFMSFFFSSCSCMCPAIRYDQNTRSYSQKANDGNSKYRVGKYDEATAQYQHTTAPETLSYAIRPTGRKYTIGQYDDATDRYISRQGNSDISPKSRPQQKVVQGGGNNFPADMTPEEQRASLPLVIEVDDVLFDFDKAVIKMPFIPELNRWVTYFKNNPFVSAEIYGHADSTGPAEYNQNLSERRAAAVVNYLVQHGVKPEQLTAKGLGETAPAASNETSEGRQKNRRVELQF